MQLYDVVLFLHLAALLAGMALAGLVHGAEWQSRRATTVAELRPRARAYQLARLFPITLLLLIVFGAGLLGLSNDRFDWGEPWVSTGLLAALVVGALGGTVIAPAAKRYDELLRNAPDGPLGADLQSLVSARGPWVAGHVGTALVVAVVFTMTVKPDWAGSVAALVVGAALGALLGLRGSRRPTPA